jgi:hypothetical protein
MPLAGYQPERRTISLSGGQSFDVTGLSLNHVAVLMREHFPDLDAIFDLFANIDRMTKDDFAPLAMAVVSQAPGFAANVIALAAGEGTAEDAVKLSGAVQVKALTEIAELTFAEVGGVGKALEMVTGLLRKKGVREALSKIGKPE